MKYSNNIGGKDNKAAPRFRCAASRGVATTLYLLFFLFDVFFFFAVFLFFGDIN